MTTIDRLDQPMTTKRFALEELQERKRREAELNRKPTDDAVAYVVNKEVSLSDVRRNLTTVDVALEVSRALSSLVNTDSDVATWNVDVSPGGEARLANVNSEVNTALQILDADSANPFTGYAPSARSPIAASAFYGSASAAAAALDTRW